MNTNELCVPVGAVSAAGGPADGDEGVAPGVGDEVEVTVGGRVSRVEGGNVYVTPETANGAPISGDTSPADGEESGDEDEEMDSMVAGAKRSMGYLAALLLLLVGVFKAGAAQELMQANRLDCSTIGTNNWVVFSNQASLVFTVEMDNFSGADVYLFLFEMGTNAVAGDRPAAAVVKVSTGTTGGKAYGPTGARFESLCVGASTTPFRYTNAGAGLGVISVTRRAER